MAAMPREHRRELEKGIFTKPQMIVKGPQQGPSIEGYCVGVSWCQGDGHQASIRELRDKISTFGKYARSSPLVFFNSTAVAGAMTGRRRRSFKACVDGKFEPVVPSQLPGPRSADSAQLTEACPIVAAIASRTALQPCRSSGGRSDAVAVLSWPCNAGRCSKQGESVVRFSPERSNR